MATYEQKPTLLMNHSSPLKQYDHEGEDMDGYEHDASACRYGCFRLFGFTWQRQSNDNERRCLLQEEGRCKEMSWWMKRLNKAKELTEVLGGPKWKTFIRKIGGYCKSMKQKKDGLPGKKKQKNRFQYDLHSYTLNFDGGGVGREGDDGLVLDSSARFAAPSSHEQSPIGRVVHETDVSASIESKG